LVCKCVQCDDLSIAEETSETKQCDHYCAIIMILGFDVSYYVLLLLASFFFMCGGDRSPRTRALDFTRTVLGHLCGDDICSTLVPRFEGSPAHPNLYGIYLLMAWFEDHTLCGKSGFFGNWWTSGLIFILGYRSLRHICHLCICVVSVCCFRVSPFALSQC